MRIFLTGANGFVGRALHQELIHRGHQVVCAIRKKHAPSNNPGQLPTMPFYYDTLDKRTDFKEVLTNIDVVVHLAARAHMPTRNDFDMHKEFMEINYKGTVNLANQALQQGVKRFLFISSIGVNGKSTPDGYRYTEKDVERPYNSYTISKLKAERALKKMTQGKTMDVVIIRPPLVYGPFVKANFQKLMGLVHTGLPLPFAGIKNQRSFIFIDNLTDAISLCVSAPGAGYQTFIVADDDPLSTPELLRKISNGMGRKLPLFYCPPVVVKKIAIVMQKEGIYNRLWGNLAASSEKIRAQLGWESKINVDDGIQITASWYCEQKFGDGIFR